MFQLPTAAAALLFTVWVLGVVTAAESIPVVPPEPDRLPPATDSDMPSAPSVSVGDRGAEILNLREQIRRQREEIEAGRSTALDEVDRAYRNDLASIDPKDMFETDAEYQARDAREKSEAALGKAKSRSEINRKFDDLLSEEVEPLFQRVRDLLGGVDVVPLDDIAVHLEKYDPEHGVFFGTLDIDSSLIETKAKIVVPMKREEARIFWNNKDSLYGRISLSMNVQSLEIGIEEFWLEDAQSENRRRTEERIAVIELRSPLEEQLKHVNGLRVAAAALAKRSSQGARDNIGGEREKAKGWIGEYNRLVAEAKSVFAKDPHIQGLKTLSYGGSNPQAAGAVTTAAKGLETYLTSFVSSDAFETAAAALAKRSSQGARDNIGGEREKAKGWIGEYNRLVAEAKSVFAKDPHIQGLKTLSYGGSNPQAAGAVTTAAKGLETYLTSFVSSDAFETAAAALAKRSSQGARDNIGGEREKAKGWIGEYNRLVAEAKSVFAKDPHIQGLKTLSYGGSNPQAAGAVTTAAKGLETYLTSFVSSDAFETAAAALAKRSSQGARDNIGGEREKAKGWIGEYNRLVAEAKSVFVKDPHIQGLKTLSYGGSNPQAAGAVTTAAKGLETYLTSFVSSDAFETAAAALAKRSSQGARDNIGGEREKAKGWIGEYNRLVAEAKSVFVKDPHIQGLKTLSYGGSNPQAAGAVTTAARTFGSAMGNVEESPRDVAAAAVSDAVPPSSGYTLLAHLPYSGRFSPKAIKLTGMLGRWFSPDAKDENGWTDLHYAAALNLPGLASALLDAGADPEARLKADGEPFGGEVPGVLSAFGKDLYGDDLGDWARNGQSPLHFAAWFNAQLVAPHLVVGGSEVDARSTASRTPLYLAAWEDSQTVAEFLIGRGADVQMDSRQGWTPLDYAIYRKNSGTAALLRRHGGECSQFCQ